MFMVVGTLFYAPGKQNALHFILVGNFKSAKKKNTSQYIGRQRWKRFFILFFVKKRILILCTYDVCPLGYWIWAVKTRDDWQREKQCVCGHDAYRRTHLQYYYSVDAIYSSPATGNLHVHRRRRRFLHKFIHTKYYLQVYKISFSSTNAHTRVLVG